MEYGFKKTAAFSLGSGELHLQAVTQSHQFVEFGDNAVLFAEWWNWGWQLKKDPLVNLGHRSLGSASVVGKVISCMGSYSAKMDVA